MNDDTQPRLRGTEDYFAYPNGLVLRRMTYESLMPDDVVGYSTQPVELFGVAPVGKLIKDLFPRDAKHGDYLTHAALDLYSDRRYDIYWGEKGEVRRRGDDATLAAISQSPGCALVLPFRERTALRRARRRQRFSARRRTSWSTTARRAPRAAAGGARGSGTTGRSAGSIRRRPSGNPARPTPTVSDRSGSSSSRTGNGSSRSARTTPEYCKDMELNRWTARRVFYVLLGAARDWDDVRRIGRSWLDKGKDCARPESIAELK